MYAEQTQKTVTPERIFKKILIPAGSWKEGQKLISS